MSKVLIVGAGGVGKVVAHKVMQLPEIFSEVTLASRTLSRCAAIADEIQSMLGRRPNIATLDADDELRRH